MCGAGTLRQKLRAATEVLGLPGVQGSVHLNLVHPHATASSGTEATLPQLPMSLVVTQALCPREKVKVRLGFLYSSHLTPASLVGLPCEPGVKVITLSWLSGISCILSLCLNSMVQILAASGVCLRLCAV